MDICSYSAANFLNLLDFCHIQVLSDLVNCDNLYSTNYSTIIVSFLVQSFLILKVFGKANLFKRVLRILFTPIVIYDLPFLKEKQQTFK